MADIEITWHRPKSRNSAHSGEFPRTATERGDAAISRLPRLGSRVRIPSPAPMSNCRKAAENRGFSHIGGSKRRRFRGPREARGYRSVTSSAQGRVSRGRRGKDWRAVCRACADRLGDAVERCLARRMGRPSATVCFWPESRRSLRQELRNQSAGHSSRCRLFMVPKPTCVEICRAQHIRANVSVSGARRAAATQYGGRSCVLRRSARPRRRRPRNRC